MSDDLLSRYIKNAPAFLGMLRAVEAGFYQNVALPDPLLDLGCGDGMFAALAIQQPVTAGIDMDWSGLCEARERSVYQAVVQAGAVKLPFRSEYFESVVCNSVLEHIPDVESVLSEVCRVMRSGARLAFCVPSERFLELLSISSGLRRLRVKRLAKAYEAFFNLISRHYHCDAPIVWNKRLEKVGFDVEYQHYYFSKKALRALEWGHYLGLPALVAKRLTGRWVILPTDANLWLTDKILRPYFEESRPSVGAYLFFVVRKR